VNGNWIAVVQAGSIDSGQPARSFELDGSSEGGPVMVPPPPLPGFFPGVGSDVMVFDAYQLDDVGAAPGTSNCMFPFSTMDVPGQAVATALTPDGRLVVQSREPAVVTVMRLPDGIVENQIPLGGQSMQDTGHDIFHRDAGGGIACASCHAEGGEDGHVWTFAGFGPRRTQALHVGLRDTEPFHWEGDKRDMSMLMEDVFVARMGGVHQSPERLAALASWLFTLTPPAPVRSATDEAAARGKVVFEGAAQCGNCHTGTALTNNETVDVGTGGAFQVPSLVGVAYRAPFVHDGCAPTLRDRFDASCGGDAHGNVADLSDTEIDDLVAYLETL